jgi:formyl-CoA transferase
MKPEITGSPLLGEHTEEVLKDLGYSFDQIANLREAKVV